MYGCFPGASSTEHHRQSNKHHYCRPQQNKDTSYNMPHNRVVLCFRNGVQLGSNPGFGYRAVQVLCFFSSSPLPVDPVILEHMLKVGRIPRISLIYQKLSKVASLVLDILMNLYFIWVVQKQLIQPGLSKYKPLVSHNVRIVCIALLMDVSFGGN